MDLLKDLWGFFKERKKYWLMPIIIVMVLLGVLIVIGGSSSVAPFIYSIFQTINFPLDITRQKSLEACLAISTGLAVIYYFTDNKYLLYASILIGVIGLLSKFLSRQVARFWYKLAEVLGKINGFLILSILFFFVLTPIAWLMKVFKKDSLHLKKKLNKNGSYYKDRSHEFTAQDIENPW